MKMNQQGENQCSRVLAVEEGVVLCAAAATGLCVGLADLWASVFGLWAVAVGLWAVVVGFLVVVSL
jgi:hypothetical protein